MKLNKLLTFIVLSTASVALVGCTTTEMTTTGDGTGTGDNSGSTGGNTDGGSTGGNTGGTTGGNTDGGSTGGNTDGGSTGGNTGGTTGGTTGGNTDGGTTGGTTDGGSTGGNTGGTVVKPNDQDNVDDVTGGTGEVVQTGDIAITNCSGLNEAAFVEFSKTSASSYNVYIQANGSTSFSLVNSNNAVFQTLSSTKMRVDIFGLTAGTYNIKVAPVYQAGELETAASICTVTASAYDRSGYAHFNYNEGVGAYNDDGSLKENAIVLNVTDANKNTISLTYGGKTVTGIGNILNSTGAAVEGTTLNNKGGIANTNQGIIKDLAANNIPLVVRMVGLVSDSGLYKSASFSAASSPLIDGLTEYDSINTGGSEGDNGHMARIKSGKNITIEGVGENSGLDGWGLHFICETSAPDLGKSFEVRNLTFINTPEDAVGMEGTQGTLKADGTLENTASTSADIVGSVERCWVHNNEYYCPNISSPAESDKSEGDGSVDFKRGQYFTCSYNYYEGCHKTNLVGSSDSSLQFNLTYHHNYWKLCKARGPLARNANIHMYNNVFEGQTDYAMNTRANSYIFSEYNLFYMCKSPQRVDGGAIKSYNDSFSSCINLKDGTIVTDKNQTVSNACQFQYRGIKYDKFDTDSTLSYIPTNDYQLQTSVTSARKVIEAKTGVTKDDQKSASQVTMSDISYLPSGVTPTVVNDLTQTLTPGKITKTVYAFTLTKAATVTTSYLSDAAGSTGVLVNEAGECILTGSGKAILNPGTYMIQPDNFQPGDSKTVTSGTFKEMTINSISFEAYDSEEYNQKIIADFNTAAGQIPSTINYTDATYNTIKAAMSAYDLLGDLKSQVNYASVQQAYNEYINLGVTYVEGLISAIGTVNANSGSAISEARAEYNNLIKKSSTTTISNYSTLIAAESSFQTFAVQSCIDKINAIGTVSIANEAKVIAARTEYNALTDTQKALITNYSTLTAAETTLTSLKAVANANELIASASTSDVESLKAAMTAYDALTSSQQANITDTTKLSTIKVAYTMSLIDAIGTVTMSNAGKVTAAEAMYAKLSTVEKASVTNYSVLTAARTELDEILAQSHIMNFDNGTTDVNGYFSVSANIKSSPAAKTYEGVTYTTAIKIESATSISFTSGAGTLIIVSDAASGKRILVDGVTYTCDANGVFTITLTSGSHTITKSDSMNVYALIVQ